MVQLSGGGTSTVEAAVADLGTAAGTRPCRCPFHADGKPSAWLARTRTGEPMLGCSTCTTVWFPVRPSPDVASMEVPPGAKSPRYMADVDLKSPVTVLHADTGSGKTRQLERIVQEVLDGAGRVLAVVHRKSLARALARRLGLTDYRDPSIAPGGVIEVDNLVICLNSICRVPLYPEGADPFSDGIAGFDLMVVEESESVAAHLMGATIPNATTLERDGRANSGEVFQHWQALAKATVGRGGRIVSTDAFTTDLTMVLLERLTGLDRAGFDVVRHLRPKPGHEVHIYEAFPDIAEWLLRQIADGKRAAVACTSADDARLLGHLIEKVPTDGGGPPKCLVYHSKMDNDVRDTLGDVGGVWPNLHAVVYSELFGCARFRRLHAELRSTASRSASFTHAFKLLFDNRARTKMLRCNSGATRRENFPENGRSGASPRSAQNSR